MLKFNKSFLATIAGLGVLLFPASAAAVVGSGTSYISASSSKSSYTSGSQVLLTIYVTSSEQIASVQADMKFDPSQLECQGVSESGSAFAQEYQSNCDQASGMVSIARGVRGTTVTGTQKVATVAFKALAGSGSTTITFASSSNVYNDSVQPTCNNSCGGGATAQVIGFSTPAAQPAVKKTATPAAATVAQAPAAPAAEQVKAEETAKTEEQPVTTTDNQPAATENDSVSVWAYLATFLAATALAAGIVYRDNLKKWAGQLKASFGGKTAPLAVAATATASKAKSTKKAPAKKKPAARKK